MKKITRIEDVYCVPKTALQLAMVKKIGGSRVRKWSVRKGGDVSYSLKTAFIRSGGEIPVDQFLDLLNDKIAPWRLLEIGFEMVDGKFPYYSLRDKEIELSWSEKTKHSGVALEIGDEAIWLDITTFTELLQQMKFLGWKNEVE